MAIDTGCMGNMGVLETALDGGKGDRGEPPLLIPSPLLQLTPTQIVLVRNTINTI